MRIPIYLLSLDGLILSEYSSLSEASQSLGRKSLQMESVNNSSIISRKYRLVTPSFYEKNQEIINSWKPVLKERKHKPVYEITLPDQTSITSKIIRDLAKFANLSPQRIWQIIHSKKFSETGRYKIEKSNIIITQLLN